MSSTEGRIEVGDWAVDEHGGHARTPVRVTPASHGVLQNAGGSWRLATTEEVAAVPIKKGDWITTVGGRHRVFEADDLSIRAYAYERKRGGWEDYDWRHATPAEYREAVGYGRDEAGEALHWDGPVPVLAAGRDVKPAEEDSPLESSHEGPEMVLVTKALEEHGDEICNLTRALDTLADRTSGAYAMIGQQGKDVSKEFAAITERLRVLEAKPPVPTEPDLPPLLYSRFGGDDATYIRVRDAKSDARGQGMYLRSEDPSKAMLFYDALFTTEKPGADLRATVVALLVCWAVSAGALLLGWLA